MHPIASKAGNPAGRAAVVASMTIEIETLDAAGKRQGQPARDRFGARHFGRRSAGSSPSPAWLSRPMATVLVVIGSPSFASVLGAADGSGVSAHSPMVGKRPGRDRCTPRPQPGLGCTHS